jgi:hypothetical protein
MYLTIQVGSGKASSLGLLFGGRPRTYTMSRPEHGCSCIGIFDSLERHQICARKRAGRDGPKKEATISNCQIGPRPRPAVLLPLGHMYA